MKNLSYSVQMLLLWKTFQEIQKNMIYELNTNINFEVLIFMRWFWPHLSLCIIFANLNEKHNFLIILYFSIYYVLLFTVSIRCKYRWTFVFKTLNQFYFNEFQQKWINEMSFQVIIFTYKCELWIRINTLLKWLFLSLIVRTVFIPNIASFPMLL